VQQGLDLLGQRVLLEQREQAQRAQRDQLGHLAQLELQDRLEPVAQLELEQQEPLDQRGQRVPLEFPGNLRRFLTTKQTQHRKLCPMEGQTLAMATCGGIQFRRLLQLKSVFRTSIRLGMTLMCFSRFTKMATALSFKIKTIPIIIKLGKLTGLQQLGTMRTSFSLSRW